MNAAVSALGGFTEPLDAVVRRYFTNENTRSEISKQVHQAVTAYGIEMQTNQLRKIISEQRSDRHELIECIKEVCNRIDPICIPKHILNTANGAYRACTDSKPTLAEELRDLRLRLNHIQRLFAPIEILR